MDLLVRYIMLLTTLKVFDKIDMMITKNNIKSELPKMLSDIAEVANKNIKADGELYPILIVIGSKKGVQAPLVDLPDEADKSHLFAHVGQEIAKDIGSEVGEMLGALFISEAWLSVLKKDEEIKVRPKDDNNRKEAVVIVATDFVNNESYYKTYEIKRDKKGKITTSPLSATEKGDTIDAKILKSLFTGYNLGLMGKSIDDFTNLQGRHNV